MVMQDGLYHYEPHNFQENIMLLHLFLFPGNQNTGFSAKELMQFSLSFIYFIDFCQQSASEMFSTTDAQEEAKK